MQSELFDCPICFLKYSRTKQVPKMISTCGHTICGACLGSILAKGNPSCPLDRTPFNEALKTTEAFPTNLLILQLLDEKPPMDFSLCETHKEPSNLVCLADKCTVCKYCVEIGNHKGHEVRHINDVKNDAVQKKKDLENQLKGFDSAFQPVINTIRLERKNIEILIKERFTKLTGLLVQREKELLSEADSFFSEHKTKITDKIEQNFILKQGIMSRIASLDNVNFDKEFFEALLEEPQELAVINECEEIQGKVLEVKTKIETSVKELDKTIVDSLTNCKPVPPKEKIVDFTANNSPNLFFYQNKIPSKPTEAYIADILEKWFGDYDQIGNSLSYISQWLYPNFYASRVNPYASKLLEHEAEIFRNDLDIAKKLAKAYILCLDYLGIKMTNLETGELAKATHWEKRYQDLLILNDSTFIMLRRILTFLNNVGFRRYAIQLVNFFEKEIYGEVGGYKKFVEKNQSWIKSAFSKASLKKNSENPKIFQIMSIYGDHYNDPQRITVLEENCFSKYPQDFEHSILFKKQDK